jgi:hypothetical protein
VENATTLINITEAARNVTVDGLRENSRYHYQILASNQFGSSSPSTPVEIGKSTHGTFVIIVQYAWTPSRKGNHTILWPFYPCSNHGCPGYYHLLHQSTYIISCVYLSGSDASGCIYNLMSEEWRIAGSIERINSKGEAIVVVGSELLLQAYASDLILDNTTNNLVVTRSITGSSLKQCPTGTSGKGSISTHV